jgi:hypothetical protein
MLASKRSPDRVKRNPGQASRHDPGFRWRSIRATLAILQRCNDFASRDMPEEPSYKRLERRGEEIYDEMYAIGHPGGLLSEIKECFAAAIEAAESEALTEEARRLRARLEHIVEVYRRQFT